MDATIPGIQFDDRGVCSFCQAHDRLEEQFPLGHLGEQRLSKLIDKIKSKGKNKKYDCVVGISGGTDSTYCLYMTKKLGLRPLAVHLDNGWNTKIATINMENALAKLDVDLRIIKCDWEEFKDLQISFLKASVPDAEIPTDLAILSILYKVAAEENINYAIIGHSFRTEGMTPLGWMYADGRYIKSVNKIFGSRKLKSYPNLTMFDLLYYVFIKRIRMVHLLDNINYHKEKTMQILEKELNWTYYGGHHFESTYARFVIHYIWKKFNIDKRKIEFSTLIRSGQMDREEALQKLKEPLAEDKKLVKYCINKLGLSAKEFEEIISSTPKTFLDYNTYYPTIRKLKLPIQLACKLGLLPQVFYEKYFTF